MKCYHCNEEVPNLKYYDGFAGTCPNCNKLVFAEEEASWEKVKEALKGNKEEKLPPQPKKAIHIASEVITKEYSFVTMMDNEETWFYEEGYYQPVGNTIIKKIVQEQNLLEKYLTTHFINEIIESVKRKTYLEREKFKAPLHLVCVGNGVYNLETEELEKHSPKHYFTNKVKIDYKEDAKCENIKKFIEETIEKKYWETATEIIAYCLHRNYFIPKAIMLTGTGANGKTVYLNIIEAFLGKENISSEPLQHLTSSLFSKAQLFGKLSNICGDLPATLVSDSGEFKKLTGEDMLSAQHKFGQPFQFKNHAKLLFAANEVPETKDQTDAFFRRWLIMDFPKTFRDDLEEHEYNGFVKKADKHLINKLTTKEELKGLLKYCLDALNDLIERERFICTPTVEDIKLKYLLKSNSAVVFCESFITDEVEENEDKTEPFIIKEILYQEYKDFCEEKGVAIANPNNFFKTVKERWNPNSERKIVELGVRKNCFVGVSYVSWRGVK